MAAEGDITLPRPTPLTITEFTRNVKNLIEEGIGYVAVRGEVSNFRRQFSGHCYFTLKDERCQVQAVMFRREASAVKFNPEDGLEVIILGRATVYEARGQYQVIAEAMEPAGVGALQLAFEQLKEKLAKEGLFDAARKKNIPPFPRRVAIVTSPSGAALRDFINVIRRRFSGVGVLVYPSAVQGPEAPGALIQGIRTLDRMDGIDVIVLARGGGSMEDLWAFNDEGLARAIAEAKTPVVCGVGHETDFTIADFVADLRAPTPSAAAELVVANRADVLYRLHTAQGRLARAMRGLLRTLRDRVVFNRKALRDPAVRFGEYRMRTDERALRLARAVRSLLNARRETLRMVAARLDALSPLNTLKRGYAVALSVPGNRVLKDSRTVSVGDSLLVRLGNGSLMCRVTGRDTEMFLPFEDEDEIEGSTPGPHFS